MGIDRLRVTNLRCLASVDIETHPRGNLFIGENASGKTSLLEALFLLGRGRSFRSRRVEPLIRDGTDSFLVVGDVKSPGRAFPVGVKGSRDGLEARIAGVGASSLADLADAVPVQVVDPEIHKLVEEGPGNRRRFLDWGVFHVEPGFLDLWRRYQRALRQRNAGLRQGQNLAGLEPWEQELGALGEEVGAARRRYIGRLKEVAGKIALGLLESELDLQYKAGWPGGRPLVDAIGEHRKRDLELGMTTVGPHRSDMLVRIGGQGAKGRVSRGQQKLLAAALTLAQMQILQDEGSRRGVLLLDDPEAELDQDSLARLLAVLGSLDAQLFLTGLPGCSLRLENESRVFHVEQGNVRTVV